jgi:hypothetical protein
MRTSLVVIAVSALAAAPLYATEIPPAEYAGKIQSFNQNNPQTDPTPLTSAGSIATGPAQLTIGDLPTPYLSSTSALNGDTSYLISARVKYYFEVSGPGTDPIPLLAHIVLMTDSVASLSLASLNISSYAGISEGLSAPPGFTYHFSFDQIVPFRAVAGDINFVDMGIFTEGVASAYADPYIFIDPAFAAAHPGYSLSFSAGVGNMLAGAVPEPASWIMMLAGFGLVGAVARRRGMQHATA